MTPEAANGPVVVLGDRLSSSSAVIVARNQEVGSLFAWVAWIAWTLWPGLYERHPHPGTSEFVMFLRRVAFAPCHWQVAAVSLGHVPRPLLMMVGNVASGSRTAHLMPSGATEAILAGHEPSLYRLTASLCQKPAQCLTYGVIYW